MLGTTSRKIVGALEKRKKASVREIQAELREEGLDIAYTTVSTILERLHMKGLVERESEPYKGAERYIYVYKNLIDEYIDSLLDGLVTVFGNKGVVRLAGRLEDISEEELEKIKSRLKM